MQSIFSRLYGRGQRDGRSRLEDYVTEALAAVFDRLGADAKRSLIQALLGRAAAATFDGVFLDLDGVELATQVVLDDTGQGKRPDMVLRRHGRDILVIESKLGAPLARHVDRDVPSSGDVGAATIDQLETYARWIAGRNRRSDPWPGAIVLLTAWTPPPARFATPREHGVVETVKTWTQVAEWLKAHAPSLDPAARALGADLLSFLKEKNLLDRHFNARDLAAVTFYVASKAAMRHTFNFVLKGVRDRYPELGSSSEYDPDVNSDLGVFYGWMYLQKNLQVRNSSFYVAIGVCTEPGPHLRDEFNLELREEPFFLVYFGDDGERQKAIE